MGVCLRRLLSAANIWAEPVTNSLSRAVEVASMSRRSLSLILGHCRKALFTGVQLSRQGEWVDKTICFDIVHYMRPIYLFQYLLDLVSRPGF